MGFGFANVVHEVNRPSTSPCSQWFTCFGPLPPILFPPSLLCSCAEEGTSPNLTEEDRVNGALAHLSGAHDSKRGARQSGRCAWT